MAGRSDPTADDSSATLNAIADAATGLSDVCRRRRDRSGPANAVLNQMAQAGGVPRTGSPAYDPGSTTDDMVEALNRTTHHEVS